jgi:hypothetical protein
VRYRTMTCGARVFNYPRPSAIHFAKTTIIVIALPLTSGGRAWLEALSQGNNDVEAVHGLGNPTRRTWIFARSGTKRRHSFSEVAEGCKASILEGLKASCYSIYKLPRTQMD